MAVLRPLEEGEEGVLGFVGPEEPFFLEALHGIPGAALLGARRHRWYPLGQVLRG